MLGFNGTEATKDALAFYPSGLVDLTVVSKYKLKQCHQISPQLIHQYTTSFQILLPADSIHKIAKLPDICQHQECL